MNAFKKMMFAAAADNSRYALTFGEQAENRPGGTVIGDGVAALGFSVDKLVSIAEHFEAESKGSTVLTLLHEALPRTDENKEEAAVLLIKNGINLLMKDKSYADRMLKEQHSIGPVAYDRCYYDKLRGRTCQSLARYNAVFADKGVPHSDDYKQATITAYERVPLMNALRKVLQAAFLPAGKRLLELRAEGNDYYNAKRCGIGFHGDAERKIVICGSLGVAATLRYYWRAPDSFTKPCSEPIDLLVEHGDIYIMSDKASGNDWLQTGRYRLVHAAGAAKFLQLPE